MSTQSLERLQMKSPSNTNSLSVESSSSCCIESVIQQNSKPISIDLDETKKSINDKNVRQHHLENNSYYSQHQQQQQQPIPNQIFHYGWWSIRPKFLQCFLSAKWALFWLCWAGAMQGMLQKYIH